MSSSGSRKNDDSFQHWCREVFQADSGFVNATRRNRMIHLICQVDSSILGDDYCSLFFADSTVSDTITFYPDTVGKYYKENLPNGTTRWVLCLNVYTGWETPFIFEIREQKGRFSLDGSTLFLHGNYACCWHGPMSGFYKIGPYYLIETCGTGSAFCSGSTDVLFFPLSNHADSTREAASIPVYCFDGTNNFDRLLTSRQQVAGDTLIVDYSFTKSSNAPSMLPNDSERYRFRAFYKINESAKSVKLLNRDTVLQYEDFRWMFE